MSDLRSPWETTIHHAANWDGQDIGEYVNLLETALLETCPLCGGTGSCSMCYELRRTASKRRDREDSK